MQNRLKLSVLILTNHLAIKVFVALFLVFVQLVSSPVSLSQTRDDLEKDKQRIEQEIVLINQLLLETKSNTELNLNQLVIINSKLNSRQNLINNLSNEIKYIETQIDTATEEKEQLEGLVKELKESYARMIYYAYRNRNTYQRMMFIFASRDFNQAYLRMRYLQQLTRHRQLQAERISETSTRLQASIDTLETQKMQQQQVLQIQRQQMDSLDQERRQQSQNVDNLKEKEKELMKQLREQQQEARDLQSAIEQVIAEERRKAREAAEQQGGQTTTSEGFRLSPAEQIISSNFADNKGKLPWPIERGIITGVFGEQPHPVLPGITIANNGIDITTTQGSRARAVFEGIVSRVINIPGGYAVIIRHGEYLSVYSNLSEVFVRNGQKVSIREEIGVAATDPREARTFMHLEVWHGNNKQDPALWIARQR